MYNNNYWKKKKPKNHVVNAPIIYSNYDTRGFDCGQISGRQLLLTDKKKKTKKNHVQ